MPLIAVGRVRRDIYSDSLLLEVGEDEVYTLALDQLKRLSSRRAGHIPLKRRYEGSVPGDYQDFPCAPRLQRSTSGHEAVVAVDGIAYALSISAIVKVARGEEDQAKIWRDMPYPLEETGRDQTTLGAF